MKPKKWIAAFATLSLLFGLVGCNTSSDPEEITDTSDSDDAALDTGVAESLPDVLLDYTTVKSAGGGNTLLYMNKLALNSTADPCILPVKEGERICFYLYVTGITGYYSYDLTSWIKIDNVFPKPSDSWSKQNYWAPEVIYDEEAGLYRMFYSASSSQGYYYISMATSESPKGPFVQWTGTNADGLAITKTTPIYDFSRMDPSHPLYEGVIRAIDVSPFVDPVTGDRYLYWCRGWNEGGTVVHSTSEVWGVKMKDWQTPDYSTVTRLTELGKVTPGGENTRHGETSINEGPYMLYHDGTYYLTYSINPASYKGYSVWQATSDAPLGTFTKIAKEKGGMVLGVDSYWDHVSGTGHHNFFTLDGELYIVYHAHTYQEYTSMGDRAVAFDRVVWTTNEDGDVILHANGPTYSPQAHLTVVSGYENAAPAADVQMSGAEDMAMYLTDGVINMHERAAQPEAEFTGTTTITLRWDNARTVRALLLYNTTLEEKAFDDIDRIEFDCVLEDGSKETRVITDASFDLEEYTGNSLGTAYVRPGSALILRLSKVTDVTEIRITISTPEGHASTAISEIEVLAKPQ